MGENVRDVIPYDGIAEGAAAARDCPVQRAISPPPSFQFLKVVILRLRSKLLHGQEPSPNLNPDGFRFCLWTANKI